MRLYHLVHQGAIFFSARRIQSSTIVQNRCTSTPLGIRTPPSSALVITVLPTWPCSSLLLLCSPSVTTSTCHLSPSWSSNLRLVPRSIATASGSWSGGPLVRPNTSLYVWAKNRRISWKSWRRFSVEGDDAARAFPANNCCTSMVART